MKNIIKFATCTIMYLHISLSGASSELSSTIPAVQAKSESAAEALLHQIAGVVAVDELYTRSSSPRKQLAHGSHRAPSVDTLRAWLTSPLETIFISDPVLAECGETIPDDFGRVREWCVSLTDNYRGARKRPFAPHEAMARKLLSTSIASEPSTHEGLRKRIDLMADADKKRATCEAIRKNIVSFCALRAARQSYTPSDPSGLLSVAELLQAGGDARALYHELAGEEYEASCDTRAFNYHPTHLPLSLQELTESFLYDPFQVMKNLHTIETNFTGIQHQTSFDWFLVGKEDFLGIFTDQNERVSRTALYDILRTVVTDQCIKDAIQSACGTYSPYTIKSVEGSSSACRLQLQLRDDDDAAVLIVLCPVSATHEQYASTKQSFSKDTYHSLNGATDIIFSSAPASDGGTNFLVQKPTAGYRQEARYPGEWYRAASDDSGKIFAALGHYNTPSSPWCSELLVHQCGSGSAGAVKRELGHNITSPLLVLSHDGRSYAVSGYDEEGRTLLIAGPTSGPTHHIAPLLGSDKFSRIIFSRDNRRLFTKFEMVSEEDKKRAEKYAMLNPALDPKNWKLIPLKLPSPRSIDGYASMTAIDPYGEYIGRHLQSKTSHTTKVIPTPYYLSTNLVPAMQQMAYPDRYILYLLDEAIRRAPGLAHISPQQWKATFKRLGLLPHLFFRPRLRLTTRDGTKLQGLLAPDSTPHHSGGVTYAPLVQKTLATAHAVWAASKIE